MDQLVTVVASLEWRPQGDSNPCRRRERAVSWASRRWGRKRRAAILPEGVGPGSKKAPVVRPHDQRTWACSGKAVPAAAAPVLAIPALPAVPQKFFETLSTTPGAGRTLHIVTNLSAPGVRPAAATTLKQGSGGARRDRTVDLLHAMQALSQLSYSPTAEGAGRYARGPGLSRNGSPAVQPQTSASDTAITEGKLDNNSVTFVENLDYQGMPLKVSSAPATQGQADACARRASVRSRPSRATVASIGGDTVPPVTATRSGCATLPRAN